jgi:hypothetical protein
MVNYAKGKIYKIESSLGNKIYIGSTTKALLAMRMANHRMDYKYWKNEGRCFTSSFLLFDEYGVDTCKIVLLEACPCETSDQLKAREAHYIKTLECVNKCIPFRTPEEFRLLNTEKRKEYYQENKVELNAKAKVYRDKNKDEINAKKREEYKNNEEKRLKKEAYYKANKEKILAKRKNRDELNANKSTQLV